MIEQFRDEYLVRKNRQLRISRAILEHTFRDGFDEMQTDRIERTQNIHKFLDFVRGYLQFVSVSVFIMFGPVVLKK